MKEIMNNYIQNQIEKYESFESHYPLAKSGQLRFLDIFKPDKNLSILDIACGEGVGLEWFKNNGYEKIIGFEANPRKVEKAKCFGFPVIEGDMHNLDFIENSFDIIYCSHSLEHAENPKKVISCFNKILKMNGIILLVLPFPDHGPLDAHCGKGILKTDPTSVASYGSKGLVDFFAVSGFKLLEERLDNYRESEIWMRLQKIS